MEPKRKTVIKGIVIGIIIIGVVLLPVRFFVDGRLDVRPLAGEDKAHTPLPYDEILIRVRWDFSDEDEQLVPGENHVKAVTKTDWGSDKDFVITGFFVRLLPVHRMAAMAGITGSPKFVIALWRIEDTLPADAHVFWDLPDDIFGLATITDDDLIASDGEYYVYTKLIELASHRYVTNLQSIYVEAINYSNVTFDDTGEQDLLEVFIVGYPV